MPYLLPVVPQTATLAELHRWAQDLISVLSRPANDKVGEAELRSAAVTQAKLQSKAHTALAPSATLLEAEALLQAGLFTITPAGTHNLTTDTAANILAIVTEFRIGLWYEVTLINKSAFVITVLAGANVTLHGQVTLLANTSASWIMLITSATTVEFFRKN